MKILLIDETDKQRDSSKARAYFVLCGMVVGGDDMVKISNELEDILDKYKIATLKTARKGGLTISKKLIITTSVFKILSKYHVEIRAAFLGEYTMRTKRKVSDTYLGALDFILERYFLSLKSCGESGLVVMDNLDRPTENELKKKYCRHIRTEGQVWVSAPNKKDPYKNKICSWLLFSEDDNNLLLQATDLIAASLNNAIGNSISKNALDVEKLPSENAYLQIYWPLFAKSPKGKVSGWGVKLWN